MWTLHADCISDSYPQAGPTNERVGHSGNSYPACQRCLFATRREEEGVRWVEREDVYTEQSIML